MRLIFSCYGQSKSQQGLEPVHILSLTQTAIPGKTTTIYHTVKNEKQNKKNMDNNKCGNEVLKQEQSHLEVGNKMNINIHKNEK